MIEQRAALTQAQSTSPLARLQQTAAQERESLGIRLEAGADGTTRQLAAIQCGIQSQCLTFSFLVKAIWCMFLALLCLLFY